MIQSIAIKPIVIVLWNAISFGTKYIFYMEHGTGTPNIFKVVKIFFLTNYLLDFFSLLKYTLLHDDLETLSLNILKRRFINTEIHWFQI